jgi:hypothetical protein
MKRLNKFGIKRVRAQRKPAPQPQPAPAAKQE